MHIQDERLQQVISFCKEYGDDKTTQQFGINYESLGRYKREYKVRFGDADATLLNTTAPKIGVLDIETLPLIVYSWSLGKQHINHTQVIKDWCISTWAFKWLNDNEVYSGALTPKEALKRDDSRIIKEIWGFIEDSNVIIAHNGDYFDIPRLNTRFLLNGLKPPLSYQTIDTLKVARKKFSFTSNKLDYISRLLGLEGKIKTEFELWRMVDVGDQEAIDRMAEYNKRDVTLLEEVYHVLGAWMPSHPNIGLFMEDNITMCPHCTSLDLTWKGQYTTLVGVYSTARCNHCGFISRSRHNELTKVKREQLNVSIAR